VRVVRLARHHVGPFVIMMADMAFQVITRRVAVLVVHRQIDAVVGAAQVVAALRGDRENRR